MVMSVGEKQGHSWGAGSRDVREGLPNNKMTFEQRSEERKLAMLIHKERAFWTEGSARHITFQMQQGASVAAAERVRKRVVGMSLERWRVMSGGGEGGRP